jgi:hypothetical protein
MAREQVASGLTLALDLDQDAGVYYLVLEHEGVRVPVATISGPDLDARIDEARQQQPPPEPSPPPGPGYAPGA